MVLGSHSSHNVALYCTNIGLLKNRSISFACRHSSKHALRKQKTTIFFVFFRQWSLDCTMTSKNIQELATTGDPRAPRKKVPSKSTARVSSISLTIMRLSSFQSYHSAIAVSSGAPKKKTTTTTTFASSIHLFGLVFLLLTSTIIRSVDAVNPFTSNVVALNGQNWKEEVLESPHAVFINICRVG